MTVGAGRQGEFFEKEMAVAAVYDRRGGGAAPPYRKWTASTASTTRSTLMPFRQRKSIGHSRRKHGEHGASDFSKRCRGSPGRPGPVSSGDVLPNGTTTGVPSAAAACIGPESLVSRTRQSFRSDIRWRRVVLPARFKIADC